MQSLKEFTVAERWWRQTNYCFNRKSERKGPKLIKVENKKWTTEWSIDQYDGCNLSIEISFSQICTDFSIKLTKNPLYTTHKRMCNSRCTQEWLWMHTDLHSVRPVKISVWREGTHKIPLLSKGYLEIDSNWRRKNEFCSEIWSRTGYPCSNPRFLFLLLGFLGVWWFCILPVFLACSAGMFTGNAW